MTLLIWIAYVLTAMYAHRRVRAHFPHWEGRAELAASGFALAMLVVLSLLVVGVGYSS